MVSSDTAQARVARKLNADYHAKIQHLSARKSWLSAAHGFGIHPITFRAVRATHPLSITPDATTCLETNDRGPSESSGTGGCWEVSSTQDWRRTRLVV